jgi:4-hydroxythreonine-4-phosphate dehydrogenase
LSPTSKNSVPKPTSKSTISNKPKIAITLGDPAGIGPEVVAKALRDPRVHRACVPIPIGNTIRVPLGKPSRQGGVSALAFLREGLTLVQGGHASALVTAPVSKEAFHLAGHGLPGHTEWLAQESKAKESAMLMVSGPMRALLLTKHVPLSAVSQNISVKLIISSARLGYHFLRRYERIKNPKIVACGLNPHAGDHGIIGHEEQKTYKPALQALYRKGIQVAGPLSSDSVFAHMAQGRYDLALAAYHDQGMIPLKLFAAERLVNITLGLPFIRTSPGHGTAYDIAGKGKANARPMIEAILLAARYSHA